MNTYVYEAILTPEEDGGYSIEVPDLDGCFSQADTYWEAISAATEAAELWVSSALLDGATIPQHTKQTAKDGQVLVTVCFEANPNAVIKGECVSAAEAARLLGVSPSRVSQMIAAQQLKAYRDWEGTYVSLESINEWKSGPHPVGRPRKKKSEKLALV